MCKIEKEVKMATAFKQEEQISVKSLLTSLESADAKTKCEIENMLVEIAPVEELVSELQMVKGTVRGVVAMSLIRIGEKTIEHLNRAAMINKDFAWVAKYLIREIKGTANA